MADLAPGSFSTGDIKGPKNPRLLNFSEFLGITSTRDGKGHSWLHGQKTTDKINELFVWSKVKSNSQDLDKIKTEIFKLKRGIGTNFTGETLVNQLWENVKFNSKFKVTEKDFLLHEKKEQDILRELNSQGEEIVLEKNDEKRPEKGKVGEAKPLAKIRKVKPINFGEGIKITDVKIKQVKTEPI